MHQEAQYKVWSRVLEGPKRRGVLIIRLSHDCREVDGNIVSGVARRPGNGNAEAAAEYIGSSFYRGEIRSTEEKVVRLKEWVIRESGSLFLACTTAARARVNYPHVRWVVHIEDPYGLIDFTQESGRGRRDGELAGSTVLMKRDP